MLEYPITVGGVTTRVLEGGVREGGTREPLVLVHGVGARADRWRTTIETLAPEGFRAVAMDLPGHGFATKGPDLPYSVPYFASFILEAMTELGISRANLVGTSLGGQIVGEAACQAPDRVANVVMVGAVGLVDNADLTARIGAGMLADDASVESVRSRLARVCGRQDLITEDWVYEEWRYSQDMQATRPALGQYMRDRVEGDIVTPRLNALRDDLGVLLVWGEAEGSVPLEVGTRSAAAIPRAELVTIPGGGHGVYYEQPEAFNKAVINFLDRSPAA
jgi:2-hydroxy-6-oxonona-2,4-dienedioate hydrolase